MSVSNIQEGCGFKPSIPIAAITLGILSAVAGVFLLLAAYQVLPHGVNAISQLGAGHGIGYGFLVGGIVVLAIVGIVKLCAAPSASTSTIGQPPVRKQINSFQDTETLEELFADDVNFIRGVPSYPKGITSLAQLKSETVSSSVMQGQNGKEYFITLKILCCSSTDDIMKIAQNNPLISRTYKEENQLREYIEANKKLPAIILLFRDHERWKIHDTSAFDSLNAPLIATSFLEGFVGAHERHISLRPTSIDSTMIQAEEEGLALLKRLMQGEEVADLNGIRWKLVSD